MRIEYLYKLCAIKMKLVAFIFFLIVFQRVSFGQDLAKEMHMLSRNQDLDSETIEPYLQKCDSILANDPNDIHSRFSKALILGFHARYTEEREQYHVIIGIDSTISAAYFNLAASYINEFKHLRIVSPYSNEDFSNEETYWECLNDEMKCQEIARKIHPLLQKAIQFDRESVEVDLEFFKSMESSLGAYLQEKK